MDTNELNLLLQFRKSLMEPLLAKCQEFSSAELNNQLVLELTRIFGFKRVRFFISHPGFRDFGSPIRDPSSLSFLSGKSGWGNIPFYPDGEILVENPLWPEHYHWALILSRQGETVGMAAFDAPEKTLAYSSEFWRELSETLVEFFHMAWRFLTFDQDRKRYRQLFRATDQFYSSGNVEAVLSSVLSVLTRMYPVCQYRFFLAIDAGIRGDFPLYPLACTDAAGAVMESFQSGEFRREEDPLKEKIRLYFPLKGKQGVYGVLEIVAGNIFRIPEEDIRFIILLTQTAGNAIENVQLYRQSKKSVENLRLLSRIARKLNGGLRLSELVPYVCGEIKRTFQADEAGLFLFREGKPVPLEGSTAFFESAEKDFLHVMKRIANEGESVFTGNFSNEELAKPLPYRSVMMVPLREEKKSMGFIVCLKEHIYAFSLDAFKLFQAIAHHTSLALSNALLREKLEWMVNTDDLTKLNTRSYFDEKLRLSMERDSCGSLLLIDIDDFKMINDTYGHHIGDEVLIQIASLIRETVSSEDVCARWGGEEMVIYLANRSLEEGLELANRIIRLAENQTRPRVTLSCGVSCWHKGIKDSPLALFKRADNALYLAKKRGKNQAVANF